MSKYVDLQINGKLFPSWILANFKAYKLDNLVFDPNDDPCNKKVEQKLYQYQQFLSKYMNFDSPNKSMLIYQSMGSGKTISTINIYNMLYNYTPGWNVFLLLKASLRDSTWIPLLEQWLENEGNDKKYRFENINFISYDASNADKAFMDKVKSSDSSKYSLYIIDECHNFINNVYTNISSKQGKRAQTIYDHIIQDRNQNENTRIIALSATPVINNPFELALLFNMLRPNAFPKSESLFRQLYVTKAPYQILNPLHKNNFQRRIMGLVSYYIGSSSNYFATPHHKHIDVPMSKYQEEIYNHYEEIEDAIERKRMKSGKSSSTTYRTYTRQACNFVFPYISQRMTGETRPRPSAFKITEKVANELLLNKELGDKVSEADVKNNIAYNNAVKTYIDAFDTYLQQKNNNDIVKGHTLSDDIKNLHHIDYTELYKTNASSLFKAMYDCSAKMLCIITNILKSPGPVLVYTNYVHGEGIDIFKIYLKHFGFSSYDPTIKPMPDALRYSEYHGDVDIKYRRDVLVEFNKEENKYGKKCKIMLVSPAGTEGISLYSIRQVHITEPHWNEVRITQMIGRAIRICSHKFLPMNERHVDVYRYTSVRENGKVTSDQFIENLARSKEGLLQSFLDAVKEVAVDCPLNKSHNERVSDIKCFQFEEASLFDKTIGPAYRDDLNEDLQFDNGTNATDQQTIKIKVAKISAVKLIGKEKYSKPANYWYYPPSGVVYDFDLHYALGKVAKDDKGIPVKLNDDTYIIDKIIPIPHIS